MKKICSVLVFISFILLSGWEVIPKLYETATGEINKPLFVESTKIYDQEGRTDNAGTMTKEIDYRELTRGINTDGA